MCYFLCLYIFPAAIIRSDLNVLFLTWWLQPVPLLSCGGTRPPIPNPPSSFSDSTPGCAHVSPAALFARLPSGGPVATSARLWTSLPAVHFLQSDTGQQVNLETLYLNVRDICNASSPLTSVLSKYLTLLWGSDSMARISRMVWNLLLSSSCASSSACWRSAWLCSETSFTVKWRNQWEFKGNPEKKNLIKSRV